MTRASATAINAALTGMVATATYMGINTGDPGTSGANEVSGGSYVRQAISWGTASGSSIANSGALSFSIPASTTVDYSSMWNASTSGTYGFGQTLSATITFVTAGTLTFAGGAVTETGR